MAEQLKAPFPWFGGKRKVARLVWSRLGDCDNYVEPMAGSCAVLLLRPHAPRVETLNDVDHYVANFWRATQKDPEAVAAFADGPVNECDLHARHHWLVLSDDAAAFRARMRSDPDYFDAKAAGWWVWGACCWIGGGWCATSELRADGTPREKRTRADGERGTLPGVHGASRLPQQAPQVGGNHDHGRGVNADLPQQVPKLSCADGVLGTPSAAAGLSAQVPRLTNDVALRAGPRDDALPQQVPILGGSAPGGVCGRPQLADAYALGRGVHAGPGPSEKRPILGGGTEAGCSGPSGVIAKSGGGTCAARRAWLLDWFSRLRDRLRCVRVCCGHWLRVCDSESVTTRLGVTGVFLDPPYPSHGATGEESRAGSLYATDAGRDALDALRDEVLAWCRERGPDPRMRLAVCGYDTDGYAALVKEGWEEVAWKAQGGYGNRSAKGRANRGRERVWFSPHCERAVQRGLFDDPGEVPGAD